MSESITLHDDHAECIELMLARVEEKVCETGKTGVIHVGAHNGEEVQHYRKYGYKVITLCEANPDLIEGLREEYSASSDVSIVHAAVGNSNEKVTFHAHRTAKGSVESGSILPLHMLGEIVPVFDSSVSYEVPGTTLDSLSELLSIRDSTKLLTLDIQGAEKLALQGAEALLKSIDALICEVNIIEMYRGCALEKDIDDYLSRFNFVKDFSIYHELYDESGSFPAWGECLWINLKA